MSSNQTEKADFLGTLGEDIVLITQPFDPAKNWIDKMQLSQIFTGKRYGLYNQGSVIILKRLQIFEYSDFHWLCFDRT